MRRNIPLTKVFVLRKNKDFSKWNKNDGVELEMRKNWEIRTMSLFQPKIASF